MYIADYKEYRSAVEEIVRRFVRGRLSKQRFFEQLAELDDSKFDPINFENIGEMEAFLREIDDEDFEEDLAHESEHAERIRRYGLTPTFHAVKIICGNFGGEVSSWQIYVSTSDFMETTPTWTRRQIIQYLRDTYNVSDPSQEDKRMLKACSGK